MFGIDRLILSKPKEVKTTAIKFVENIKKVVENQAEDKKNPIQITEKPKLTKPALPKLQKLDISHLNKQSINNLKPAPVKTVANNFLDQINKVSVSDNIPAKEKLLFSYSDSKGKTGQLTNKNENLRIILRKNKLKSYDEDIIEVYSVNVKVFKSGVFMQSKGWGNTEELAIANALKKAIIKISNNHSNIHNQILFSYSLATTKAINSSEYECKITVISGKV